MMNHGYTIFSAQISIHGKNDFIIDRVVYSKWELRTERHNQFLY